MKIEYVDNVMVDFRPENYPKAKEIFDAALSGNYRVIITGGAVRGGKSFTVGGVLMCLHYLYPKARSIVVRDTIETLRTTTLETVNKLIPPKFIKHYRQSPVFQWTFQNGGSFQFFSEQADTDPERRRWNGLEVNFIWLEQIEELQRATFEKALERVGSYFVPEHLGKQPPSIIFVTLNPTDTWAREFYDLWINDELPDDWLYVPSSIEDNSTPAVQEYKKSLETLRHINPVKYAKFVKGDWNARERTGKEWLHRFDRKKHVGRVDYLPAEPTYLSFDFNSNPYMTMISAQTHEISPELLQVRIYDCYTLASPRNRSRDCVLAWDQDYNTDIAAEFGETVIFYTGDASGHNKIPGYGDLTAYIAIDQTLQEIGLWHSTSGMVYREHYQNAWVRDFVNDVLAGLHGIEVIIDEELCNVLILDLEQTLEGNDGGPFKVKKKDPKTGIISEVNGHPTDAFKTLLMGLFPQIFKHYKKRRRDAFISPGISPVIPAELPNTGEIY